MNKYDRKRIAEEHYEYTQRECAENTHWTVLNSNVYYKTYTFKNTTGTIPVISVENLGTEEAIRKCNGQCCALNFASFTSPGGGFINGAMAQEEALCHKSNLYDVLVTFTDIYNRNYRNYRNHGLYQNWAIWSPKVRFIYNEDEPHLTEYVDADIITCPAPNYSAYIKNCGYGKVDEKYYQDILKSRCKFVLDIAEEHGGSTLILGAFGCGVFGNDPKQVANIFKDLLTSKYYNFKKVVFAIPNSNNENYMAFKEAFK